MYDSFRPGQVWLDTDGKPIQAHGGSILAKDGSYYWYGENKEKTVPGSGIWHWGVRCYSSDDLYNWKDEGLLCPPCTGDRNNMLHPSQYMDRPHLLYNKLTDKYVMWMKIMCHDGIQRMTIALSDSFPGKFSVIKTIEPLGMSSGDFDLVVDPDSKKGYIYFERVHHDLICAELTDDYTDVTGVYTVHFPRKSPPFVREAPAFFVRNGVKYLFTSGTTGYFPNPSEVASAPDYHGPWTVLGDPHTDDPAHDSYCSQICSVFRLPDRELYIALADRWLIDLPEDMPDICHIYDVLFNGEKEEREKAGKSLRTFTQNNTSLARYVWLPVQFDADGKPYLKWYDEWKLSDFAR